MILLGLVGGAAVGLVALRPAYESQARVLVRPITGHTARDAEPLGAAAMATERELVSADGVAELMQRRTGWAGTLDNLRRPLRVSLVGGTQTIAITYRAGNADRARLGAQTFAESYLAYRGGLAAATRDGARRNLEAALREISDRIARARASLPSTTVGAEAAGDALSDEAAPYQARLAEVAAIHTTAEAAGAVVQPATLPTAPSGSGPLTAAGIGALLGLAAGAATASLRETVDRRLRGRSDLEDQLGAPVLASVPRTRREGHDGSALVTLALPHGPAAEAYRGLRARLLSLADRSSLKTVMVASPTAEGATTVIAANLAVSMASTGRRVTLVQADLRSPDQRRYFDLDDQRGLSNVLAGEMASSEAAQKPPGLETLRVLPAGSAVDEPAVLLESGPMQMVLDERGEVSDFVVVEAPPALSASEALTLAPMVDGIVVVADARHATREELAEVGDQLRLVGGNVVGAVLCNVGA
jgi:polysaccharide biosynthesis transport protein